MLLNRQTDKFTHAELCGCPSKSSIALLLRREKSKVKEITTLCEMKCQPQLLSLCHNQIARNTALVIISQTELEKRHEVDTTTSERQTRHEFSDHSGHGNKLLFCWGLLHCRLAISLSYLVMITMRTVSQNDKELLEEIGRSHCIFLNSQQFTKIELLRIHKYLTMVRYKDSFILMLNIFSSSSHWNSHGWTKVNKCFGNIYTNSL